MCLFIGDIGDNKKVRDHISIYKVAEPTVGKNYVEDETHQWEVIHFKYPDGAHNSEAMMVDPNTRDLVVVTKSPSYPFAEIYSAPLDQEKGSTTVLFDAGISITLPSATDATISADGQVVIIRLYVGGFLWPRKVGEMRPILDILKEQQCLISVGMQKQGEGVALNPDGTSYYTHSEGVGQNIWQYRIL